MLSKSKYASLVSFWRCWLSIFTNLTHLTILSASSVNLSNGFQTVRIFFSRRSSVPPWGSIKTIKEVCSDAELFHHSIRKQLLRISLHASCENTPWWNTFWISSSFFSTRVLESWWNHDLDVSSGSSDDVSISLFFSVVKVFEQNTYRQLIVKSLLLLSATISWDRVISSGWRKSPYHHSVRNGVIS